MGETVACLGQPAVLALPTHHTGMNRCQVIACHPFVNRIDMGLKLCSGLFNTGHAASEHSADKLMVCGGITRPRLFSELRQ